jgi:hypothetical protein
MYFTWIITIWSPLLADKIAINAYDTVTNITIEKASFDHLGAGR